MTLIATDSLRLSNVLKYEFDPAFGYCRDVVTAYEGSAKTYKMGTVLGKTLTGGAGTATAGGSNTGNGTMGTVTVGGTAKVGTYTLTIVKAATNAGDFVVKDPNGVVVGYGTVAVAFSGGGLSFTLADGSTDFVVGDSFTIAVTGTYKYKIVEATATDGSAVAVAMVIGDVSGPGTSDFTVAATTDTKVLVLARGPAIVADGGLTFGSSVDTQAELDTAYGQLASLNPPILVEKQV